MDKTLIPKVDVPVGRCGKWTVEKFRITENESAFTKLRALFNPQRADRSCQPGTYTKLLCDGSLIMSDTRAEMVDHLPFVLMARGNVLITGLGIGMVLNACLLKPEVNRVTVVEIDPDLIHLVGPHYLKKWGADCLQIICADAYKWRPPAGSQWDLAWHDIWPSITSDNLPLMAKLKRHYLGCCNLQLCWAEDECRASKRRQRKGYLV